MVDAKIQRKNMVESQVRPSDITDRRILAAMQEIPREEFVPVAHRSLAYIDDEIRLKSSQNGETPRDLMSPRVFAKLLQLADIGDADVVLDVGSATGYSAAVLAHVAETVVALESDQELAETASQITQKLSIDNVVVVDGNLASGYPSESPFDAIIVEGTVPSVPAALLDQLKDGGRLVAIIRDGSVSKAVWWRRYGEQFDQRSAFEASAPDLPDFVKPDTFVF